MTSNQQLGLKMYDAGQRAPFGLAGDSQRDTRQQIMHLLADLMPGAKLPKAKCGVTALDEAVKIFRQAHPPAPAAPMAEERDTAQWYVVNSQMAEIRAIVGDHRGGGWNTLGEAIREALRRELYRIRSIGEGIDIAAGRSPQTGEPLPASAFEPHAFIFEPRTPALCKRCTLRAGAAPHLLALPGMETAHEQRAEAQAIQTGEDLTAQMREPLKDISSQAGKMERDAPLFYGTGSNPTLF